MSVPAMMSEQRQVRRDRLALADRRALEEQQFRKNPLTADECESGSESDEAEYMGRALASHIRKLHGGAYFSKFSRGLTADDIAADKKVGIAMKQVRDVGNQEFSRTAETREETLAKEVPKAKFTMDQRQVRAFGSYYEDDVGKVLPTPAELGGLYNEERLKKPAAKPLRAPRAAPAPVLPSAVEPDVSMVASGKRRGGFGTGRYEGQGHAIGGAAVPSFGLSQFRGGEKEDKHTLMDHIKHPKKGFGKAKRAPSARNVAISKLMREKGMTLGAASKYIKEHGL